MSIEYLKSRMMHFGLEMEEKDRLIDFWADLQKGTGKKTCVDGNRRPLHSSDSRITVRMERTGKFQSERGRQ